MTHAYDKLYLEKARAMLGRMLDFAVYDLKLDIMDYFVILNMQDSLKRVIRHYYRGNRA